MFCGLKSLSELYLGDNQLQGIEFSLQCLEQLSYVSLEYNKIRRLDDKTLRKLDQVFASDKSGRKTINLKGNPFRCDCHLDNFYDWLYHTNISFFHKVLVIFEVDKRILLNCRNFFSGGAPLLRRLSHRECWKIHNGLEKIGMF